MPQIKNNQTGDVFTVASEPRLSNGVWECGNQRFTDYAGTEYTPVSNASRVGPIAFKLLFTALERIKATALRGTDEFIEDFWGLLDDPRTTEVDLGLASVQSAVEYTLTSVKAAGVDLDVAVRKAEILSGQIA